MWTSTWTWNMTVRVKQKHLILIPQHHWSPTASHPPPPSHPPQPHHPPAAHPYSFHHRCFWKFSKNWKEVGNNMHRMHVVLRFRTQITCPHRGQQRLCTWQWTKIKIQWQLIWPWEFFQKLEHNITYEILTKKTFWNRLDILLQKLPFWNVKRAKNWHSKLCVSTFSTFFGLVLGSYCRKMHDVTVMWPFENIFHRTNTVKI